ncbi:phosphotransferase [Halobacillus litoralis]|uniref:Phosphotransferase n=1 Tax=Halobacillus litoralis TaxID=45668 RepID=A0A845E0V9_9BACI|nr:phosphotransferase [Halobacillus litoralis]MYL48353.1 phosphotransferase [Halobacillus litoralis]
MSHMQNDVQWQLLCFQTDLGKLVSSPESITGGLLHKMYGVKTAKDNYAVKVLNPVIMRRPEAMTNYMNSEKIANHLSNYIPALPANLINGTFVHEIDHQFYMVFDRVEGGRMKPIEIKPVHSRKIGSILADIHKANCEELELEYSGINNSHWIEWHRYMKKGQKKSAEWVTLLERNIDKLYEWEAKSKKAAEVLSSETVMSHRDLDPKNVMWYQGSPVIIDWESAGSINPMQDLIETAVYWSTDGQGNINEKLFLAFLEGYQKNSGELCAHWERVLDTGYLGKLNWLEYNLKRSLQMECSDEKEQKLGAAQVKETIMELQQYENSTPILLDWLNKKRVV